MAQIYEPETRPDVYQFTQAAFSGAAALQGCWDTPDRAFRIDDAVIEAVSHHPDSHNALQAAVQIGNLESVHWLLDHGANIDAVDVRGMTCLLSALSSGHWEKATTLLELGASTHAVSGGSYTMHGQTYNLCSQPATLFALACSTEAVQFLADAGVQPTDEDLVTGPTAKDFSFLSSVTDCHLGTFYRPRPPLHELLPLMRLASRHVTAAQHYALCKTPLVCNATLDGAIVYLTGGGAGGAGTDEDASALCVPNSLLLTERSAALGAKLHQYTGGFDSWSMPKPPPFPLWIEYSVRISERVLPAVLVATWGSRCPAMRFVARLCGAPGVPAAAEDVPFPLAPAELYTNDFGSSGWANEGSARTAQVGDLDAGALLAAVAACQVGAAMTSGPHAHLSTRGEPNVSPAAVRMLAAWASGVLLCSVRRLLAQAGRTADRRVQRDAAKTLELLMGVHGDGDAMESAPVESQFDLPSRTSCVTSLDSAAELLLFARQEKRLVCSGATGQKQRWSYCMSHEDMGALLGFATWRLRRGLLLRRAAAHSCT